MVARCGLTVLLVLDRRPRRPLEIPQHPRYPRLASSDHWLCYFQPSRYPDVAYWPLRPRHGPGQQGLRSSSMVSSKPT